MSLLWAYSFWPGDDVCVQVWPANTELELAADRPTLVMFVHPLCPCSSASLGELENLLVRLETDFPSATLPRLHLVYSLPQNADKHWIKSKNVKLGANLFGETKLHWDEGGVEAERFGAHTSGVTYLFGPSGKLWYFGGITPSRGHAGDNFGKHHIRELLINFAGSHEEFPVPEPATCPVFGCTLDFAKGE